MPERAPEPPPGFRARAPRRDEAETVAALVVAFELASDGESETTPADVLDWWSDLGRGVETWLVLGPDGAATGYAELRREEDVWIADGYVHPDWTGRGVGGYLVELMETAAREAGGAASIRNTVALGDPPARRLLEHAGYRAARYFHRMAIELPAPLEAPRWPRGYAGGGVAAGEERAFHAVLEAAFAEHWGSTPERFEDWLRRKDDSDTTDRSLWFTARTDRAVVAALEGSRRLGGGWIGRVGVLPAHRHRGLGRALLLEALHAMAASGEPIARLGVDTANPTGATELYRSVGMRVAAGHVVYEKDLR